MWGQIIGGVIGAAGSLLGSKSASDSADDSLAAQMMIAQMQQELAKLQMEREWQIYQEGLDWRDIQWDNSLMQQDRVYDSYLYNQRLSNEYLNNQKYLQDWQMGRQDYLDKNARDDRLWALNDLDYVRGQAANERALALQQYDWAQGTAQDERLWDLNRLMQVDNMEQLNRQFAVDQYNWQRQLAGQEAYRDQQMFDRAYADKQGDVLYDRQQIEDQRRQMAMERDQSIAWQEDAKRQLEQEREWSEDELRANQRLAQEERALQEAVFKEYMAAAASGDIELQAKLKSLGTPAERRQYGEADFNAFKGDLSRKYQELTDRAVQQATSVNEADLIRRGMTNSKAADMSRGVVAGQAANAYIDAETRAYQEAMGQVQALNEMSLANEAQDMTTRNNLVQEALNAYSAPLQALQSVPDVQSGIYDRFMPSSAVMAINGPSAAYSQLGTSSVYDRQLRSGLVNTPNLSGTGYGQYSVGSALDFNSPMKIPSLAVQAQGIPSLNQSPQMNISGWQPNYVNYSPYGSQISMPTLGSNGFNQSMSAYGAQQQIYGNQMDFYQQQGAMAGQAFGDYFGKIAEGIGNYIDS